MSSVNVTAEARSDGSRTSWPIAENGPEYRYRQTTANRNAGTNTSAEATSAIVTKTAAPTNPTIATSRSARAERRRRQSATHPPSNVPTSPPSTITAPESMPAWPTLMPKRRVGSGGSQDASADRKRGVEGKRVDLGGRRIIKKKKKRKSGSVA